MQSLICSLLMKFSVLFCSCLLSVERILNQISEGKRDHSPTTLTAADVPWPQVIETCVGTLLSWLHSTPPSLTKENVYYMEEDLENFNEPALWSVAVTETLKLAKKTSATRLVVCEMLKKIIVIIGYFCVFSLVFFLLVKREKEKNLNTLHNLTFEVEEELQRIKCRCIEFGTVTKYNYRKFNHSS